jgi:hypothetical protein
MTGFVFLSVLTLGLVGAEFSEYSVGSAMFPAFEGGSTRYSVCKMPPMMSNSRLKSGDQGSLDNGGQAR